MVYFFTGIAIVVVSVIVLLIIACVVTEILSNRRIAKDKKRKYLVEKLEERKKLLGELEVYKHIAEYDEKSANLLKQLREVNY